MSTRCRLCPLVGSPHSPNSISWLKHALSPAALLEPTTCRPPPTSSLNCHNRLQSVPHSFGNKDSVAAYTTRILHINRAQSEPARLTPAQALNAYIHTGISDTPCTSRSPLCSSAFTSRRPACLKRSRNLLSCLSSHQSASLNRHVHLKTHLVTELSVLSKTSTPHEAVFSLRTTSPPGLRTVLHRSRKCTSCSSVTYPTHHWTQTRSY